jgi:hypothetical protein
VLHVLCFEEFFDVADIALGKDFIESGLAGTDGYRLGLAEPEILRVANVRFRR